jgi:hypothetical protein
MVEQGVSDSAFSIIVVDDLPIPGDGVERKWPYPLCVIVADGLLCFGWLNRM